MTPAKVHESVEVDGLVEPLDFPIEHYTESSLSQILIKIDQYSTLGAEEAFKEGQDGLDLFCGSQGKACVSS